MNLEKFSFYDIEEKERKKFIEKWHKKAEKGNKKAMYIMSEIYSAKGVDEKYIEWLKKASEKKLMIAQVELAKEYIKGVRINQDIDMAIKLLTKPARKGRINAMTLLANCYTTKGKLDKSNKKLFEKSNKLLFKSLEKYLNNKIEDEFGKQTVKEKIASIYINLGINLKYLDEIDKAEEYFNKAIKTFEYGSEAKTELRNLYYENNHFSKGILLDLELAEKGYSNAIESLKMLSTKIFDFGKFAKLCLEAIDENNTNRDVALYELAECFELGKIIDKNNSLALKYYEKASKLNYDKATFRLGEYRIKNSHILHYYSEGIKYFKILANKGNNEAKWELYKAYLNKDVKDAYDLSKALEWLNNAANSGYIKAQKELGNIYYSGEIVNQDYEKVIKYLSPFENEDDLEVLYKLSCIYSQSHKTYTNYKKAFNLAQRAADKGHIKAKIVLAYLYRNGYGVEKNYKKTIDLLKECAEKNDSEALYKLGKCYFEGTGVDQNYQIAINYLLASAKQGYVKAYSKLGISYMNLGFTKDTDIYEKDAVLWLNKGRDAGDLHACPALGVYYYNQRNYSLAMEYLQKGIELKEPTAWYCYGRCVHLGLGGYEKDINLARHYYEKSASEGSKEAIKALEEMDRY